MYRKIGNNVITIVLALLTVCCVAIAGNGGIKDKRRYVLLIITN